MRVHAEEKETHLAEDVVCVAKQVCKWCGIEGAAVQLLVSWRGDIPPASTAHHHHSRQTAASSDTVAWQQIHVDPSPGVLPVMCWVLLLWATAFPVEQRPVSGAVDAACLTCPILSDSPYGCLFAECNAHNRGSMPGDSMACHAELTWTFSGVRPVSSSSSHPGCSQSTFSVLPTNSRRRYVVL